MNIFDREVKEEHSHSKPSNVKQHQSALGKQKATEPRPKEAGVKKREGKGAHEN